MSSDVKKDRAKLRRELARSAKPFSQSLFDSNDSQVKARVLEYIRSLGMHVKVNPDLYGPDLVVFSGFAPSHYVEVEVKHTWKAGDFPFRTVQLPERKEKYSKLKLPCEYWVLNSSMDSAIVIPSSLLASSPKVEVPNRYVESGEYFFQIPIEQCRIINLGVTDGII